MNIISKIYYDENKYIQINRKKQLFKAIDLSTGLIRKPGDDCYSGLILKMPYRIKFSECYYSRKHIIPDYVRLR